MTPLLSSFSGNSTILYVHLIGNISSCKTYKAINGIFCLPCYPTLQKGSFLGLEGRLGWETHLAKSPVPWNCLERWHQRPEHNNQLHGRMQHLVTEIFLVLDIKISWSKGFKNVDNNINSVIPAVSQICMVTSRSSTMTSLVRKSAPMVALYWLENLRLTYWFISEVLPTPESPKIITFNRIFLREAMVYCCSPRWG